MMMMMVTKTYRSVYLCQAYLSVLTKNTLKCVVSRMLIPNLPVKKMKFRNLTGQSHSNSK